MSAVTPERYQQLKQVFHSALGREPGERAAFLAEACAGDEAMRREVEALLASHEQAESFIETPPFGLPAGLIADARNLLEVGRRVSHFEILDLVGRGGMAEVYLAEDKRLGRKVALKVLSHYLGRDADRSRRFEREARLASSLSHPNICSIYEVGEAEEGLHFIAMEYIDGVTLRQHMARARLEIDAALDVATQVASALAATHHAGIAHRDIKPENIMLRPDGYIKVLDFGLAKLTEPAPAPTSSESQTLSPLKTIPGAIMGTARYMSPEQARGLAVDARTDVWSLGVVLYEMLSGHAPFDGPTSSDVMASILNREPPPLRHHVKEIPESLELVVAKAITKPREDRYQTISDMARDLKSFGKPPKTHRVGPGHPSEGGVKLSDAASEGFVAARDGRSPAELRAPFLPERRKQVTVLFAALSGLLMTLDGLDPEFVSEVMNSLWRRLIFTVSSHGGVISERTGDTLTALWGAQESHEDDPEQAIRAGLAMQSAVVELTRGDLIRHLTDEGPPEADARTDSPPLINIGINTGPALLGSSGAESQPSAAGAAVNFAKRLGQTADAGAVIISHDTYRHVRGIFDVRAVGTPDAGRGAHSYTVLRAKPRAFRVGTRGVEGVETRMIGRDVELERMLDALRTVIEDRELRAVTVVGEAGIGKSRLLYEFISRVELEPRQLLLFNGRAVEANRGRPYFLARDLFSLRFGIKDSDPPDLARQKLVQGIVGYCGESDETVRRAHFIGHILGFDFSGSRYLKGILHDARQIRDRAFCYAAQFFAAAAHEFPVAICLEDLHWADDGSLDFINHLARACPSVPLLILCSARPGLFERRPGWGEGLAAHTRLSLQPLSKRESRQLVGEILRLAEDVPQAIRETVVGRAEGNPFYVEELIKMLIDRQVITPGPEKWQVDGSRFGEAAVPATLTGVLQARIDGLPTFEKRVLQLASVVGREFWDGVVGRLCFGDSDSPARDVEARVRESLEALRRKELVYRREASALPGADEYIFKHALMREVAYEGLLKRELHRYHSKAAAWLVEQSGERVNEYAGAVAWHYESAGEGARAASWYGRAARRAREAYALTTAVEYYRKALSFLRTCGGAAPQDLVAPAQQLELYDGLGESLGRLMRFAEGAAAYEQMRSAAELGGDLAAQARAWNGLAFIHENKGDYRAALENARRAEEITERAGADQRALKELAAALNRQAWIHYHLRDAKSVLDLGARMLAVISKAGTGARHARAHGLNLMGIGHHLMGRFKEAGRYYGEALALFRQEPPVLRNVAAMLNSLGLVTELLGDYGAAVKRFREALTIAREIGERIGHVVYLGNLGGAHVRMEDYGRAESYLREAVELAGGDVPAVMSELYRYLAEASLGRGRYAESLESALRALELGRQVGNPESVGAAWRVLGRVATHTSAPVRFADQDYDAESCFNESLKVLTTIDAEPERARTLREWARYQQMGGHTERGQEMWQEAFSIFSRLEMSKEVENMRAGH